MAKRKKRSKQPSQVPPLDERHYLAIELMIKPYRNKWLTRQEIADMVGISRMQLYRWEQRKDFQKAHDTRLRKVLKEISPRQNRLTLSQQAINGDITAINRILEANGLLG